MKRIHQISSVFIATALVVALGAVASFWVFNQIGAAVRARQHTIEVTNHAADLLADLLNAETGQRGFALTGDETFLEPYLAVRETVSGRLEELRNLTEIDDARQHLDTVRPLLDAKLAELAQVIQLRRNQDVGAVTALISNSHGKRLMDSIRAELKAFNAIENLALEQHEADFQSSMRRMFAGLVVVSAGALLLGGLLAYLFYRENEHRLKTLLHLETVRLLGLQTETSERLGQANAKLQRSEERLTAALADRTHHEIVAARLAAIVASSDDAIIGKTLRGVVTSWNAGAEHCFGYTAQEMEGESITRLIPADRLGEERDILERIARGESVRHFETVRRHKDGHAIDVSVTVSPIKDAAGTIIGASKVVRDISEQKRTHRAETSRAKTVEKRRLETKETVAHHRAAGDQDQSRGEQEKVGARSGTAGARRELPPSFPARRGLD